VAGSLQDYDRAVLVGQKTFGKGLVQTTRQLSYNAQLKVTTAKYYIPSGRCIQALDYTNRKSDGTVHRIADSLKSEFKTRNGRKVFDGGGLDPDILVKRDDFSQAVRQLAEENLFFEYATKYCSEKPSPASIRNFRLTEEEYQNFVAWAKGMNFTYTSDLEKQADELITSAKNEKYYDELQAPLKELKNKIKSSRENDLMRYKAEISRVLEEEIAYHYQLHQGQIEVSFDRDDELKEAIKVLTDSERYKKILLPQ
jgi:carboxyl-terminal processing protease